MKRLRTALGTALTVGLAAFAVVTSTTPALAASALGQVTGLAPGSQNWTAQTIPLSWKAVSGATTYVSRRSTSSSFSSPSYANYSTTKGNIGKLKPATKYYVEVAAKNGSVSGKWSAATTVELAPHAVATFGAITVKPGTNGVTVSFPAVANASDYEIRWSAGPNENRTPDRWTPHWISWFSAFGSTNVTRTLTASASDLTATPYGNPIYVRVYARNTYYNSTYVRASAQGHAWPTPPQPNDSDLAVHMASYNVLCSGCEANGEAPWSSRVSSLASVINARNPDILTTLEASGSGTNGSEAWTDLDNRLPNLQLTNSANASGVRDPGNRIFFNPTKYRLVSQGTLDGILDYRDKPASLNLYTPWAEFQSQSSPSVRFIVVAAHFAIPNSAYWSGEDTLASERERKELLGDNSAQLLTALNKINPTDAAGNRLPVIFEGDVNDNRYPEDDTSGAQPTLIRGGFSDASASKARYGTAYATYNDYVPASSQAPDSNGDGQRIDYVLTQGFAGSDEFVNNYNPGTSVIPSDHNMIEAFLRVPAVS